MVICSIQMRALQATIRKSAVRRSLATPTPAAMRSAAGEISGKDNRGYICFQFCICLGVLKL